MRWNIFLIVVSVLCILLVIGVSHIQYLAQAEAVAEELAPQISVDEDTIRTKLKPILRRGQTRRAVVYSSPFALLSLLLTAKIIVDLVGQSRDRKHDRKSGTQ